MRVSRHLIPLVAVLFVCSFGATLFMAVLVVGDWFLNLPEAARVPAASLEGTASRDLPAAPLPGTAQPSPTASHTAQTSVTATLPPVNPTHSPQPVIFPSELPKEIVDLMAQMTLEEKIGQMILSGIAGSTLTDADRSLIGELHPGGVVYFGRNTSDAEQTRQLSADLQDTASGERLAIPLLIAIDHEGGRVFRFQSGMTHFPPLMALGAAGSPDLVYRAASAAAGELRYAGINMNLGPVLDVNDDPLNEVISLRSFGSEPELVARMGVQYEAGLLSQGIIPVSKHFPGHGSTSIDSHRALPTIDKSLDQMLGSDLVPFQTAIQNGADAIMAGHLANLQIDSSGRPATLSPAFVQQLLREQLGFEGVVVTDAMSMGAIVNTYGIGEASVQAVEAGCDLLAFALPEQAVEGYYAVLQAAQSGRIPMERIDEVVRRLLLLKRHYNLLKAPLPEPATPDMQANQALALEIARQAIAYRGVLQTPFLNGESVLIVSPIKLPTGSTVGDRLTLLGEILTDHGYKVEEWIYDPADIAAETSILVQAAGRISAYEIVLFVVHDALLNQARYGDTAQLDFIDAVDQAGVPILVVAAASPYDLTLVASDQPALVTFGEVEVQVEALADALLSATLPGGQMPVDLP